MKTPRLLLLSSFILATFPLSAEQTAIDALTRAATLNEQGQFHASLALIEPLLQSKVDPSRNAIVGIAWNLYAVAHQNLGDIDQARHGYENAISILRTLPDRRAQLAVVLDNLASFDLQAGQLDESKALRIQAIDLYKSLNDHAGIARTSSNLALFALRQKDGKTAKRALDEAFYQESFVPTPDVGDLAGIYAAQTLLDARNNDFYAAVRSINHAIDLWTAHFGPRYYLLADGYSLRGQAYRKLSNFSSAIDDLQHALSILQQANLSNSEVYLDTQIAYAHILRDAGRHDEASRLEKEATTSLADLHRRQCSRCVVSAESFR